MSITQTRTRHESAAADLMAKALFIRAHEELPLGDGENPTDVQILTGSDEEKIAVIARAAAVLGVKPRFAPGSTRIYEAVKYFGNEYYRVSCLVPRLIADPREPAGAGVTGLVARQYATTVPAGRAA